MVVTSSETMPSPAGFERSNDPVPRRTVTAESRFLSSVFHPDGVVRRGGTGQHEAGPAADIDWGRVTDQSDVDNPLEQRGLSAEPYIDGARADAGLSGDGVERGARVAVLEEQPDR